jgi:Leucine-rich repeat (LRR) protein
LCSNVVSLTNLETIELRENMLKTLPASMASLTKLLTLDLGGNMFDELVSCITVRSVVLIFILSKFMFSWISE